MTGNQKLSENSTTQRLARAKVEDFSDNRAEKFADRMLDLLTSAALTLMISVGHRVRLFDVMSRIHPATCEEIARAARLNASFVGEWLESMVRGSIIEYYSSNETYYLPSEHAVSLTRSAAPVNIASTMQFIGLLGGSEDRIVSSLRDGTPLRYSTSPRFFEVMWEEEIVPGIPSLIDSITPLIPGFEETIREGVPEVEFCEALPKSS